MQKLANQLISLFALSMVALGWAGLSLLNFMFVEAQFTWYPYIPATFLVMGISTIVILSRYYKLEAKKLVNVYMLLKLVKLVVAMSYLVGFYFIVGKDIRTFGCVFAAYYAIYIGLETGIFYLIEKQIKKEA